MAVVASKQLTILQALTAHLETLSIEVAVEDPDTGDVTVIGKSLLGQVFRGRTLFGAEEHGPFLSILEGRRPDQAPDTVGYDRLTRNEDWHLLVQGFFDDDPDNPLDNLYRLKALVEERLAQVVSVNPDTGTPRYPEVYLLGGLILDMQIGPGVVAAATPTTGGTEAFYLPVLVNFAMNVADPFSVT